MVFRSRILAFATLLGLSVSCYSAGGGSPPPFNSLYFPVGLAVSEHGNVLYAANSDFDLQWNGGTVQSFNLFALRRDTALMINDPSKPLPDGARALAPLPAPGACPFNAPLTRPNDPSRLEPAGWTCAPPIDPTSYVRDAVAIGAFATDLVNATARDTHGTALKTRLFSPVRGDASVTWLDVAVDSDAPPPDSAKTQDYGGFAFDCGTRTTDDRCDAAHHAGTSTTEPGNSRGITLPGEPFAIALTEDRTAFVVTHQNTGQASLFLTGFAPPNDNGAVGVAGPTPSLQFVLEGLPGGGVGIAPVPHDPDAYPSCTPGQPCLSMPHPAFLGVSRITPPPSTAQVPLMRYYDDQAPGFTGAGGPPIPSSVVRPFLIYESATTLTVNAGSVDQRGIVMDPSPRIRCKAGVLPVNATANPPRTQTDVDADTVACARLPARVFIASRSPASLIIGTVGESSTNSDSSYDADRFSQIGNTPLPNGPTRLFLAPIVDANGNYALRIFIICYDASQIVVYDPDAGSIESVIDMGRGPFAVAFDPFNFEDAALGKPVPVDTRYAPELEMLRYRFAYVASFTDSFMQILDLDGARADKSTFETVVFRMGMPVAPKGS